MACFIIALIEFFLWGGIPLVFLFLYIGLLDAPVSVFFPHLKVVCAIWLGVIGARLLVWRFFMDSSLQRALAILLFLLPPLLLSAWYVCVLIGLVSWGRIITWPMLKIYLLQGEYLFDVLGFSKWLGVSAFVLLAGFFFIGYVFLRKIDVSLFLSRRLSALGLSSISLLGMSSVFALFFYLPGQAYDHPQEPFGISFFPGRASALQSHAVAVSPRVDAAENKVLMAYKPSSAFERRNVVLIVGDALRSDHMGLYGYSRDTTPYLSASMSKYQTLWAASTRSVCAESSCGLMALASSRPLHLLPSKPITLHRVLKQHGYRINLMLSGDHTNFYGLKEAYGNVDFYFDGTQQSSRYVNDDYLLVDHVSDLPRYEGGQPVMFQFHLMSTHGLGARIKQEDDFKPVVNYYGWHASKGRIPPSLSEIPKAVNYYDNGVKQFDLIANKILDILQAKGYLDNAVVVFVGDHGEMLGEKGRFGHQHGVDEGVLRIPFVLQRRGYSGEEFGAWSLASQIDVAPTILKELGVIPPSVWLGVALQSKAHPRLLYFQQAPKVGLYIYNGSSPALKYWRDLVSDEERVFDLKEDPEEKNNIISQVDPRAIAIWRVSAVSSAVSGISDFSEQ